MKTEQVNEALEQKFLTEGNRLVFWHDANGEFADYLSEGLPPDLASVTIVNLNKEGGLGTKLLLERKDTQGKYLLYSTGERAPAEEDWLLDIRHYSAEFHADLASIWLQELGLGALHLRDHLRSRERFLGNQERRRRLATLICPTDDQAAIDLKMTAVIAGSEVATLFSIIPALCEGHLHDGSFAVDEAPKGIELLNKMGLLRGFWELVRTEFGYAQDTPSLAGLLRCLFVSEFLHRAGSAKIDALAQFKLPPGGQQNAVVCLTQWRDSSGKSESYDATARALASELKISERIADLAFESLAGVFTFWEVEPRVVSLLRTQVLNEGHSIKPEAISSITTARKAGHWLSGPGRDEPERKAMGAAYAAIEAAAELFFLARQHEDGFRFDSPQALVSAYETDLYRFDQLYRRFSSNCKGPERQGWDLLKSLAVEVERLYDQGFLWPLGQEWDRLLEGGFLDHWSLSETRAQRDFFANTIKPYLDGSERRRAFVIISDAFRYEAAQELMETLNGRYRMNAELSAMLGVLPSYTALGMASLLPHATLGFSEKGDVLVDGKATAGTEARNKQLATVGGMACQAEQLRVMKQEDARNFTDGARVLYIYHNVIDARGDTASTESETFAAVDECIEELVNLVQFCVNKLNASQVWVTADHGFLYQVGDPVLTDKSPLTHKPTQALKMKKRYVIGREIGSVAEAHCGSTQVSAGTEEAMTYWVPRGCNRFHFTGGARFLHGGAMPQEVLIPLVSVRQLRGRQASESRVKKVSVQVLGAKHKITSPSYRFELIQTEAVSDRRLPITLRAAVYDGALAVTSVETLILDSASESLEERKKSIKLNLSSAEYDKSKPYRLVLRDAETDTEVQSLSVVIDRSFTDDF